MGSYYEFKEMFERFSKEAGKKQYLIPYFISAHPGSTNEDMMALGLWLKAMDSVLIRCRVFIPRPWRRLPPCITPRKIPLKPLGKNNTEQIFSAKTQEQRTLHKAFLRYHDAENWPMLRKALRRMGARFDW